MRPALPLVLLASLLLAGCSGEGGEAEPLVAAVAGDEPGTAYGEDRVPLRFAIGDVEGSQAGKADFVIQGQCVMIDGSCGEGQVDFDLTPIVPANAPVEMIVKVYGANADLVFEDAFALGEDQEGYGEYDGQATNFAPVVVRGEAGKVTLRVFNPGGFSMPPEPNPSATYEAHTVVRAGLLVPGVPATMHLEPGQRLNLTSQLIEDVLLFAPDGTAARDDAAPFELVANATAGDYTVLLRGGEATPVYGPNVTMTARRLQYQEGEVHALASGQEATWTWSAATRPLQVGVDLRNVPTAAGFGVAPIVTQFAAKVTAPGEVVVVDGGMQCSPTCSNFVLLGAGVAYTASSAFLDEHLLPGDYAVSVTYTGNGMQAVSWSVTIA